MLKQEEFEQCVVFRQAAEEGTSMSNQYLVLARYTINSWKRWMSFTDKQREDARDLALQFFPLEDPKPIVDGQPVDIPGVGSVRFLHTFRTALLERIMEIKAKYPYPDGYGKEDYANSERTAAIAKLYDNPPEQNTHDPGIGWVIIADEIECARLLGAYWMKPFWELFEIEVIPLNSDASSEEFYINMTPTNWKT